MWVDSHCHLDRLDLKPYGGSLSKALDAARLAGVQGFLSVGVDLDAAEQVIATALPYPDVWASVGLHPSDVGDSLVQEADFLRYAAHPKVVAIGEMGLDYHYGMKSDAMESAFRCQIRVARALKKPIIVHTREAVDDTLRILREEQADEVGGVMHCFTESWEMARAAIELGFLISFSGIITFKNAVNVMDVARQVPLDCLLVETDAPYLAPVPHRGQSNQPLYVPHVGLALAVLKGVMPERLAEQTTHNFHTLFQGAVIQK